MIVDYSDNTLRQQLLDDLEPILVDYVVEQLDENLPRNMTAGEYSSELTKIMKYLRAHLTIEFKD
jgi:hypothetical protein